MNETIYYELIARYHEIHVTKENNGYIVWEGKSSEAEPDMMERKIIQHSFWDSNTMIRFAVEYATKVRAK